MRSTWRPYRLVLGATDRKTRPTVRYSPLTAARSILHVRRQPRGFSSFRPKNEIEQQPHDVTVTQTPSNQESSMSMAYSIGSQEDTQLVDDLLAYTRRLMDDGSNQHVVAFSGGIDSSVVATLVHQVTHPEKESTRAVLGLSLAVPPEQVVLAEKVAQVIGIHLDQIPTTEGSDATYIENSGQACLACKTHLYTCLQSIVDVVAEQEGNDCQMYNGTNADDLQDPTRLGLIAADRFHVQSPLQNTIKDHVRRVGRHLGLPNWNYAASPCLRSRLALGVEAIPEHLKRIDEGERIIRGALQLHESQNMRVRLLANNRAMIEVDEEQLEQAKLHLETWQTSFREKLGFSSTDVRQFKSGAVAQAT